MSYHPDEMLRQTEAAERLGYSVSHFKSLGIPHIGRHKAKRYRWGDIMAWQEQNKICPAPTSIGGKGKTGPSPRPSPRKSSSVAVPNISEALARLTGGKQKLLPAG